MDNLDIEIKLFKQKNRANTSNIYNCEDYYRIAIFISLFNNY